MGNYYQPEIETMPVEKLQALQSERLVEQVKYVYDHVEFYRNKMKEAGVETNEVSPMLLPHYARHERKITGEVVSA